LNHKSTAVLSQEGKNKHHLRTKTSSVFSRSLGTQQTQQMLYFGNTQALWSHLCVFSERSSVWWNLMLSDQWHFVRTGRK